MMRSSLLLIFLFTGLFIRGQQGYTFNRISTDDALGLSSNRVYCTYQDKKGFIWVGTANGLQRFDGSKFISIGRSNPGRQTLPVADLTQILAADSNQLWLFFPNRNEIGLFNTSTFKYQVVPSKPTGTVPARHNKKLWVSSQGEAFMIIFRYGMLQYNRKKNIFEEANPFHLPAGWITDIGIYEDTVKRQIWMPCPDSGLAVYDIPSGKTYTRNYNPRNIPLLQKPELQKHPSELFIDSRKRQWVFNWDPGQFKRCYDENGTLLADTAGINANPEYSELSNFFETSQGVLWVYGANGLFNFDNNFKRFYFYEPAVNSTYGMAYQAIFHIMEDRDGSIWISTDNGLYFTTPGSGTFGVVNILFSEAKGGVEITDLLQLQSGQFWLSTWGRGVLTLDPQFNSYAAGVYDGLPAMPPDSAVQYRQAWALYQHRDGKIWIGCQAGKLIIYDTLTKKSQFTRITETEGATIRYITGDAKGNIWFSTQRGQLIKYDGKSFTRLQQFGTIVPKILIDKEGYIWLATFNQGLYQLSPDGTRIIRHFTSDGPDNRLFINSGDDLDQVNDSTIAYGAGALNLIHTKTGKVSWRTFDDGLPSNTIRRIRADKQGNLWIITSNGLCRYNPRTNHFTPYGRKDGITLAHLTTVADLQSKEDYIMFAGTNALMYFEPALYAINQPPPDVVITDFKLFNEFKPVDSLLALPRLQFSAEENSFTIFFSSLSYSQKEKLAYYYRMDGIDKDWIRADRQGFANYPVLPPGHYTFNVYAENIDGLRSRHITTLHFHIRPPFWKTYWFLSSLALFFVMIGYALHRLRVNRLLAVEKIRNRVARDLHDDMGSTLSTINILSTMAKTRLNTDTVKTSEYISKISENSQRMMEAMDDIVWSIKPMNDSMPKIIARMREYATSILEARDMEVQFEIEEEVNDVKLDMEARRDFFLVFKEAVNNAAKYSGARTVWLRLHTIKDKLIMLVQDNGKGFIVTDADNGNGLGNMQKRADAMKGHLQIESAPGKGTSVQLVIPAG